MVNPQHQTPQGQSVAKPGTLLQNILDGNLNMTQRSPKVTCSGRYSNIIMQLTIWFTAFIQYQLWLILRQNELSVNVKFISGTVLLCCPSLWLYNEISEVDVIYILTQKRRNTSALAMDLNPFCISPSIPYDVFDTSSPFYQHGLIVILAWINNHMPNKVRGEITYPFLNFNGATVEVWEWISNFIPYFAMDVITYPCWE